jgi:hypothetical protein
MLIPIFYGHFVCFTVIWYILWPFGIFNVHLAYFTAIWYILWLFGIIYGHLEYLFLFWYVVTRNIWPPWAGQTPNSDGKNGFFLEMQKNVGVMKRSKVCQMLDE